MTGATESAEETGSELLPELGELPGHLFWRANFRVLSALDDKLPRGVDVHACATLLALPEGTTRSQQEVADAIGVSRTTMAGVAASLTRTAHLTRVRNPEDRRSWALSRTSKGAADLQEWTRHLDATEATLTASLTDSEREELRNLLVDLVGPHLAPDAPAPLRRSIGYLITREHAHLHRLFADGMVPTGVEPRQFGTLVALRALGATSQIGLARRMGVSGARMVWIIDELEDKGYVERHRDPADRRAQLVHLTRPGAKALLTAERIAARVGDEALAGLSESQLGRLCELLRRIITA